MRSIKSPNLPPLTKPMRILHVVGGMDRGGAETWLMHVLRQFKACPSNLFEMDFLTPADQDYAYTDELKALGSKILPCQIGRAHV